MNLAILIWVAGGILIIVGLAKVIIRARQHGKKQ